MKYIKSSRYDNSFIMENMMGPNSMKLLEELTTSVQLEKGMRVLDLGCGKGLTSVFLAKEFGVQVFATDLWITATENYQRFQAMGVGPEIIPIHADALNMPYADEFFDAVVSVDAYHYFGRDAQYMDKKLAPLLKKGGMIALAFPGLKEELKQGFPHEMALSWTAEDIAEWHTCEWWKALLEQSNEVTIQAVSEMEGFDECWNDWLSCANEYAIGDRAAMEGGAGKYMNFVSVIARKK